MKRGDILFVDEIHMQAVRERRGQGAATEPEVWYSLMEDHVLMTQSGPLPFPEITVIGATTDPGMLPEPFVDRFPLRPQLEEYSPDELVAIAGMNARKLGLEAEASALRLVAGASRGVPRVVNNLMRNAALLGSDDGYLSYEEAADVLAVNGISHDGLTKQMQDMLTFLYRRARRERGDGEVTYQASVNTIATAIGLSRDTKAVSLHVEPYLIRQGFIQVGHGGRTLTDAGVRRAKELLA
jgi:Holliday junction DNA helicase RuvB